jgi:DNA repair ATPase RecN
MSQQDLKKRLLWLESQIEGLEKRSLSLMGGDGSVPGYYSILNDLQARLDRQSVINNNYEPRLQQLNQRIEELETEVAQLRNALLKEQNVKDENEALKDAFRQVSDIVRDPKRMRDI